MKVRNLLMFIAILAFSFTACEDEDALTPNPTFNPEATGDDPQLPNGGNGGGNDTTGGNGGNGGSNLVVEQKQRAIITYVGATWCPPCGAYGDPTKVYIDSTYGSDAVMLNIQSNDAISSSGTFEHSFGNAFQTFVGTNGIPHIYFSGANFSMVDRGFTSSSSSNNSSADSDINAILGNSPEIGVAAKALLTDDTIYVETLTKFYSASSETFIGVYVLEDSVMALQKISGSPEKVTSHENVMRGAAHTSDTLGTESIGISFNVDQEVIGNYKIPLPGSVLDVSHLQVAVIVWESDEVDGISNGILVDVE